MTFAAPVPAHAAVAWVDNGSTNFWAGSGEANRLTVSPNSSSSHRLDDTGATISAGQGCARVNANRVLCSSMVFFLWLYVGDGNDTVTVGVSKSAVVDGGSGNDTLTGGPRDDTLDGKTGDDTLDGGLGADTLNGGDGTDGVSYSTRTAPVTVTLDGVANDGEAGENDDVAADVENVTGGSAGDTLTGSNAANVLAGGAGDDTLNGGAGDDTLDGGAGSDTINGGDGNDTIQTRDGAADQVTCGAGSDSVTADPADTVAADCESVDTDPAGDGSAGNGPSQAGLIMPSRPIRMTADGIAPLRLTCGLSQGACEGSITLYAPKRRQRSKAMSSRRSRPKRAQIGRARFSVAAGRTERVKVRLSRNGRRRVLRQRKLRCRASVKTRAPDGKTTVAETGLTLLAPATPRPG